MDFDHSPKVQALRERVDVFMRRHARAAGGGDIEMPVTRGA